MPGLACLAALLCAATPVSDPPVADAARRGDREAVRALLRQGADVNAAHADGMTALHWAAQRDDAETARMLIHAGAAVEAVTRIGHLTPLHLASRAGNVRVVELLLEAGSDPDVQTTTGGAAVLHFAARQGSVHVVRLLLDHGADIDLREDAWSQTPLMWAAAENRVDVIRLLLEAGADAAMTSRVEDIAEREKADRRALQARKKRMEALRAPEPEEVPDTAGAAADSTKAAMPDSAQAAARDSAEAPAADSANAALPDSAKVEPASDSMRAAPPDSAGEKEPEPLTYGQLIGNKGGLTPLLLATREGHMDAVRTLLDAGADVNQSSDGDHTSALLIATINGHFDLAMFLIEGGADPRLASEAGATPLYATLNVQWAPKALYPQPTAYKQQRATYLEVRKALIDAGADVNARLERHLWYMSFNFDLLDVNTAGATPFWRAAYATDVEAMRLLVAHGADPNISTRRTPERRRRADGSQDQEEKKDPSGLPPVPIGGPAVWPIHAASGVGSGEGYAANAHRHVPDGWLPAVKYLVEELGADVNARDHNGYNAVHHAAARGDNELIEYLVARGAEVTAVSRKGQTTADMANGPVQRVPPFPATIALLEKLGSKNSNKCRSC